LSYVWKKPVITFFKERLDKPETEPFAVVKAKSLTLRHGIGGGGFEGEINSSFTLMGDVDTITAPTRYVLCWMDDREDDFKKAWRRLSGVTFPKEVSFKTEDNKRTYEATFRADYAKLK